MSANTLRIVIAILLVAHGFIHYSLTTVPLPVPGAIKTPFWPSLSRADIDTAWLASQVGLPAPAVRTAGWILLVITLAAFSLAGLGLFGIPGLHAIWAGMAGIGSVASLLLLVFYWHPWLVLGVAINLAVLSGITWHFPTSLFLK